ncbi:MAG: hypothetical protein IKI49_01310 [Oscillospiraceae bacterium]|nr:hypothetical protein [Oscillospiraceae bacterium]
MERTLKAALIFIAGAAVLALIFFAFFDFSKSTKPGNTSPDKYTTAVSDEAERAKIIASVADIMRRGERTDIELSDGNFTQYEADDGKFVIVTPLDDGTVRYETYSDASRLYKFCLKEGETVDDADADKIEMTVFNAAAYRVDNRLKSYNYKIGETVVTVEKNGKGKIISIRAEKYENE